MREIAESEWTLIARFKFQPIPFIHFMPRLPSEMDNTICAASPMTRSFLLKLTPGWPCTMYEIRYTKNMMVEMGSNIFRFSIDADMKL